MKAIKTRRVAALGATCALAAAGMFGAMAANADEEPMSGGQSGSEQSGGNGGEEGQSGGEEGQSGGEEGQSGGEEGQSGGEEGQSGGEEGQSGGEEGGNEGVVVDGLSVYATSGNVLDTTTQLSVYWDYTEEEDGEGEGTESISLRADSDFVLDTVTVAGKSVDFTCGDVTESEYGYAYATCDLDFGPVMAGGYNVVATSGDFTATSRLYRYVTVTSDVEDGKLTQQQCSPVDVTYTVPADQLKYLPAGAELTVEASNTDDEVVAEKTVAFTDGKAVVSLDPDASEDAYYVYAGLDGLDSSHYGGLYFYLTVEPGCAATGGLAQTGANAGWVALAALATIGAGAGAVAINRRRA